MLGEKPPVKACGVYVEINAVDRCYEHVGMWSQMIRAEETGASGTVVSATAACSSVFCVSIPAGHAAVATRTLKW